MKTLVALALSLFLLACTGPDSRPAPADPVRPDDSGQTRVEPESAPRRKSEEDKSKLADRSEPQVREARGDLAVSAMPAPVHAGKRQAEMMFAPPPPVQQWNREGYDEIIENGFRSALQSPLSTFGLDVDTASYSNVRRFLTQGRLPPADAVRIEELINYFDYSYPQPADQHPLSVTTEVGVAPWNPQHRLALVGVKARDLDVGQRAPNRLVFLLDTSGSMNQSNKLPLLKRSFQILVEAMDVRDSVAIVTYAGSAGLVLPPTPGSNKEAIYAALNRLQAGGSTAGARGIELAYQVAEQQRVAGANNRVILATDGDFNVGASSDGELVRLIEARRDSGIFLSVLGFGSGNYQDGKMQKLAGHGNGTHHYIDTDREAERVFRDKLQGTLYTVAKDVKIQIEFNPAVVARYRLIGYENRLLNAEDFVDDRKDAGDVGAGHSITVLYEIVPAHGADSVEPLRYQSRELQSRGQELAQVRLRYKAPDATRSVEFRRLVNAGVNARPSANLQWATAVAELGLLLGESQHRAQASYGALIARAEAVLGGADSDALRREFVGLARQAKVAAESAVGMR